MSRHVIITAGGTVVPIDAVRSITNQSGGRFPWQIALTFAQMGWRVTVIGSRQLVERVSHAALPKAITLLPFLTYDDLVNRLDEAVSLEAPDALLMAAAVSDYGADTVAEGKLPSDQEQLTITLRRLPKIISTLRQRLPVTTFLVGFKLTSGASLDQVEAAARKQLYEDRCNLVVHNDLSELRDGQHPVTLFTPEGGAIRTSSNDRSRNVTAEFVARVIDKRVNTRWWHSRGSQFNEGSWNDPDYPQASKLLELAQSLNIFISASGNASLRTELAEQYPGLWITPRGLEDKSTITARHLVRVETAGVTVEQRLLRYETFLPELKPSIDTGVHALLYQQFPRIGMLLHTHSPWVLCDTQTQFPYPCGTAEEYHEIASALEYVDNPVERFCLGMVFHGYLIGRPKDELDQLALEWQEAQSSYHQHLQDIDQYDRLPELHLFPIWAKARPIGVAARHTAGWYSIHLSPEFRGHGFGEHLVQLIKWYQFQIGTIPDCQVADFYTRHGLKHTETLTDGTAIYTAPLE